jgi:hypothetical protein
MKLDPGEINQERKMRGKAMRENIEYVNNDYTNLSSLTTY